MRPVIAPGWSVPYVSPEIPWIPGDEGRAGCNCWGGVRLVFGDLLGVELDPYGPARDRQRNAGLFAAGRALDCGLDVSSTAVRSPIERRPLDVVVFEVGGIDDHCGLVVEPDLMLHWSEKRGVGMVDRISRWGRLSGVYRHVLLA